MTTTNRLTLALALVLTATFNTGCLGALAAAANYQSCDDVQDACEDFVAVTCGKAADCGGDFDECVDGLIDAGFECGTAWDLEGDMDECLDDVEDVSCEDFIENRGMRSCSDVNITFEDGVCN